MPQNYQKIQVIRVASVTVPLSTTGSVTILQVPPDVVRGRITSFTFEVKPTVNPITITVADRDFAIPSWDVLISGSYSTPQTFSVDVDIRPNMEIKAIITNNSTIDVSVTIGIVACYER